MIVIINTNIYSFFSRTHHKKTMTFITPSRHPPWIRFAVQTNVFWEAQIFARTYKPSSFEIFQDIRFSSSNNQSRTAIIRYSRVHNHTTLEYRTTLHPFITRYIISKKLTIGSMLCRISKMYGHPDHLTKNDSDDLLGSSSFPIITGRNTSPMYQFPSHDHPLEYSSSTFLTRYHSPQDMASHRECPHNQQMLSR